VRLEYGRTTEKWRKALKVRWNFPETQESRTFRLEYVVRGVLKSRERRNILDWAAVGYDWEITIRDVDVVVRLPWAFESGVLTRPIGRATTTYEGTTVTFWQDEIEPEDGLRIIVEFPEKIATSPSSGSSYAASVLMVVGPGVLVIIVLLVVFWRRVGKVEGRSVSSAVASYPDPSVSVAAATALTHYGTNARASVASAVFDLARRGIILIEARAKKGVFNTRSFDLSARVVDHPGDLPAWDEKIVAQLKKEPRLKKLGESYRKVSKIVSDVTDHLKETGLISKERLAVKKKWLIASLTFSVVSTALLLLVVLNVWKDLLGPALLLFGGSFMWAVTSAVIETRSPRGMTLAKAFKAYGKWRREEIDSLVTADPSQAVSRFTEHLPELILDRKFNKQWIGKMKKEVKKRPIEFTIPAWMDLRDESGNPADAAAAAVECFEAFSESVAVVAVYAGGAATAGGGGGGAGGGGGGAG
jgi:hypothetical protein